MSQPRYNLPVQESLTSQCVDWSWLPKMMTEVVPSPTSSSIHPQLYHGLHQRSGSWDLLQTCQTHAAVGAAASIKADLGCRMCDIYLPQNCIAIICQHNTCKGRQMKRLHIHVLNAFTGFPVRVPPEESSSIFSIALGPRVVRTMSDTACASRNIVHDVRNFNQ